MKGKRVREGGREEDGQALVWKRLTEQERKCDMEIGDR